MRWRQMRAARVAAGQRRLAVEPHARTALAAPHRLVGVQRLPAALTLLALPALLAACAGGPPAPAQATSAAPAPPPSATQPAPRPLYRDPLWDGAADAAVVFNRGTGRWEMFYTRRRATLRLDDPRDVRWVHGTAIGIAGTADGNHWRALGEAQFPAACTGPTNWAPEIVDIAGTYHLWLTVVPGIHARWTGPRHLQYLTSTDLRTWRCEQQLDLGSDKVIDAAVVRLPPVDPAAPPRWRLWFKDEARGSRLMAADSDDLRRWTVTGPVHDTAAEGPKVFHFQGRWWLIADLWRGLLVKRSDDATHWATQPQPLLAEPGRHASDRAKGQHPDVVVVQGRAFLFYFVHQGGEDAARSDDRYGQRSVIQVAELSVGPDGWLTLDRDAPPPDLRQVFGPGRQGAGAGSPTAAARRAAVSGW